MLLKGTDLSLVKRKCSSMWFALTILNLLMVLCKCGCPDGCASICQTLTCQNEGLHLQQCSLVAFAATDRSRKGHVRSLQWPPPLSKLVSWGKDSASLWGLAVRALANFSADFPRACFFSDRDIWLPYLSLCDHRCHFHTVCHVLSLIWCAGDYTVCQGL